MVKKILSVYIVSLFTLIYSCSGIYGMDEAVQEYHPRASRSSLFKTALVGLGLMLSPTPVDSFIPTMRQIDELNFSMFINSSKYPTLGIGGDECYLMKYYYNSSNQYNVDFNISEIRTTGNGDKDIRWLGDGDGFCNRISPFQPLGIIRNISMILELTSINTTRNYRNRIG